MAQKICRKSMDEGASELIGELMILAITVIVFGILAVSINGLLRPPHTDIVSIGIANNSTTVSLTHMGGDSIPFADVAVMVNGAPAPMADGDADGDGRWEPGESIYVANTPADQGLDVLAYDKQSNAVFGDFKLR